MRAFMSSAAIFFMLSITSLAEAEIRHVHQSGQYLIDNCDMGAKAGVDSWIPGGICMGYVSAISDMLNTFEDWGYWNSKKVCIEKRIEAYDLGLAVIEALKLLPPSQLEHNAAGLTVNAMTALYPCEPAE